MDSCPLVAAGSWLWGIAGHSNEFGLQVSAARQLLAWVCKMLRGAVKTADFTFSLSLTYQLPTHTILSLKPPTGCQQNLQPGYFVLVMARPWIRFLIRSSCICEANESFFGLFYARKKKAKSAYRALFPELIKFFVDVTCFRI
jgi:hypothetical protein